MAIDGKTVRGSKDTFHSKSAVHLVHAWSVENGLCLGQRRTAGKSNEITAIPELLDILDIAGSIVTVDAMGTQTAIAEKIVKCRADYILVVKGNQGELRDEVGAVCKRHRPVSDTTETEKGHGRIETRHCQVFEKGLTVDPEGRWAGLQSAVKITATRGIRGKITTDERLYISSLGTDSPFNRHIRDH